MANEQAQNGQETEVLKGVIPKLPPREARPPQPVQVPKEGGK
jgi:hypothetical protein